MMMELMTVVLLTENAAVMSDIWSWCAATEPLDCALLVQWGNLPARDSVLAHAQAVVAQERSDDVTCISHISRNIVGYVCSQDN